MGKMIMYWRSNSKTELGYYGIDSYHTRSSDANINLHIAEAFANTEVDDEEPENVETWRGEPISDNICHVVIEHVWIENFVDLSYDLITKEICEISEDILDNFDENSDLDDESNVNMIDDNSRSGKSILDYNIDDLLGSDDNDSEKERNIWKMHSSGLVFFLISNFFSELFL